jgi:hypothetical protein
MVLRCGKRNAVLRDLLLTGTLLSLWRRLMRRENRGHERGKKSGDTAHVFSLDHAGSYIALRFAIFHLPCLVSHADY